MSLKNYALVILKPDTLRKYLDNTAIQGFEAAGLQIIHRKIAKLDRNKASRLYKEKSNYNYFDRLVDFMSEGQSMILLVKGREGENATKMAKGYRDWARDNLRRQRFKLTKEDVDLLNLSSHERQAEITQKMALENLIHVSDRFENSLAVYSTMLNSWELSEVHRLDPEIYATIQRLRETSLETAIKQEGGLVTTMPGGKEIC